MLTYFSPFTLRRRPNQNPNSEPCLNFEYNSHRHSINILQEPIRGGTDGAQLSFMGLPCPNIGCGGGNFHGRFEYCVIDELELSVQVILKIIQNVAEV